MTTGSSLLNVGAKSLKIAYSGIYEYLESNNFLHKNQFGFRRKHCTIDAMAEFMEKVRAPNDRKLMATVFIDLKKAIQLTMKSYLETLFFMA